MKHLFSFRRLVLLLACGLPLAVRAQTPAGGVGIGTTAPHPSAALDVSSTTKGLLPPRMTQDQRDAIAAPAAGLTIYNTTTNKLNTWNGTAWTEVLATANLSRALPSVTFSYTGGLQTFTVPPGVGALRVTATGAAGGTYYFLNGAPGGRGGRVVATLPVNPGEVLTVYVGQRGADSPPDYFAAGGYNGGGNALARFGGGGGGATDLRRGTTLADRLLVAGGGGGGMYGGPGGNPGGAGGNANGASGGEGGTATAGGMGGSGGWPGQAGVLGRGGDGGSTGSSYGDNSASGGGGGYYGGGGGGVSTSSTGLASGGGGSSWVSPTATSVSFATGVSTGNGSLIIEPLVTTPAPVLDGTNFINVPGTYDNLGNHVATQDLSLGAFSLTGGGSQGLSISTTGALTAPALGGSGPRMLTTDNAGLLGTASLPTDAQQLTKSGSTISLTNGGSVTDADNQTLSISGATISLSNGGGNVTVPSSADNLGNHAATQNLNLGTNQLVGNGGSQGLSISAGGNVGIGASAANSRLSLSPTTAEAKLTLWDGGNTTAHYGLGVSGGQFNYHVDGSSARHVFYAGGKNGDGTELLRIDGGGGVVIGGNSTPIAPLEIRRPGTTASAYMSFHNTNVDWFSFGQDVTDGNKIKIGSGPNLSGANYLTLDRTNAGIGTTSPTAKLDVNGSLRVRGLTTAGVVTTDAAGNLGSVAAASLADNLGNHVATQSLDLGSQMLVGTGDSLSGVGVGVRADGGLNLGQHNAGHNVLLGYQSGKALTTGANNTFSGYQSGKALTTGANNTFTGYRSGTATTTGISNTFLGSLSGEANTTGSNNVFVGLWSGRFNTTGGSNTFVGPQTGSRNTTGAQNVFVGYQSGRANGTGSDNLFIGYWSGQANTTANGNVFIGTNSGQANTTGFSNLFVGRNSGFANTTGYRNQFVGDSAGRNNTTGTQNYFSGFRSGALNTTGSRNTYVGYQSGYSGTTASGNLFVGFFSGYANTTGSRNQFVGDSAGVRNTTGTFNHFSGYHSGETNTTGSRNVFVGPRAGRANTSGADNLYAGYDSGRGNTTGYNNVFLGAAAGPANTTGNHNFFGGYQSGLSNTAGTCNVFLGAQSGRLNTSGQNNAFLGFQSGQRTTTGEQNTFSGSFSGPTNTTGTGNVFNGYQSGNSSVTGNYNAFSGWQSGYATTASNNSFFGGKSGYANTTGTNNSALGYDAGPTTGATGLVYATAIGAGARVSQSYSIALGGYGATTAEPAVNVGIATPAPYTRLSISPSATEAKITLWDGGSTTDHYGLGVSSGQLNYHVDGTGARHVFYAGGKNGNGTELMRIQGDGNVGIGTNGGVLVARLHVSGNAGSRNVAGSSTAFFAANSNSITYASSSSGTRALAAYFDGGQVWVNSAIVAGAMAVSSDARIKRVVGLSDRAADLARVQRVQITDYTYIDQLTNKPGITKKVIAQQVRAVYPEATTVSTSVIPNVFERATRVTYANGRVSVTTAKPHELPAAGGRMRLYTEQNDDLHVDAQVVDAHTFSFASETAYDKLFVYGKYVDDFLTVDYDALSMLNISATQELARQVEELQRQNAALQAKAAQAAADHAALLTLQEQVAMLLGEAAANSGGAQARK